MSEMTDHFEGVEIESMDLRLSLLDAFEESFQSWEWYIIFMETLGELDAILDGTDGPLVLE